jgi:hypothetical protein
VLLSFESPHEGQRFYIQIGVNLRGGRGFLQTPVELAGEKEVAGRLRVEWAFGKAESNEYVKGETV